MLRMPQPIPALLYTHTHTPTPTANTHTHPPTPTANTHTHTHFTSADECLEAGLPATGLRSQLDTQTNTTIRPQRFVFFSFLFPFF